MTTCLPQSAPAASRLSSQAGLMSGEGPLSAVLVLRALASSRDVWQGMAETQGGTALFDPLEMLTQHGNSSIGAAIAAFSILAVATSFIGTTLGEYHR